jgi:hypothetical protein
LLLLLGTLLDALETKLLSNHFLADVVWQSSQERRVYSFW